VREEQSWTTHQEQQLGRCSTQMAIAKKLLNCWALKIVVLYFDGQEAEILGKLVLFYY